MAVCQCGPNHLNCFIIIFIISSSSMIVVYSSSNHIVIRSTIASGVLQCDTHVRNAWTGKKDRDSEPEKNPMRA